MGATNSANSTDNLIAEDYPPFQLMSQIDECVGKWRFAQLLTRLSTFQVGIMAKYLGSKSESPQRYIGLAMAQLIKQSRMENSDKVISGLADMKQEQKFISSSLSNKFHKIMLCLQLYLLFWAIFEYGRQILNGKTTTVGFFAILLSFMIQITFFSFCLVNWWRYRSNQKNNINLNGGAADKGIINLLAFNDKSESEIFDLLGSYNIYQLKLMIKICQMRIPENYRQQKKVKKLEDKLYIIIQDNLLLRQIYYESCEPTIKDTVNALKVDIRESHLLSIGNFCIGLFHLRIIIIDAIIKLVYSKINSKPSLNRDNTGIIGVSWFIIGLSLAIFTFKICKIKDHFREISRLRSNLTTMRLLSISKAQNKGENVKIEKVEKIEEDVKIEEEKKELMAAQPNFQKIKSKQNM